MHRLAGFVLSVMATLVLSTAGFVFTTGDAEARRLGGGRSFGARPAYSTPYKRTAPAATARSATHTAARQKNAALRDSLSRRGGLMGLLGGLALGGLLGALFFGGAFEGINFLDLLVLAGLGFLLYKLLASRRQPAALAGAGPARGAAAAAQQRASTEAETGATSRPFETDLLFGRARAGAGPAQAGAPPAGFDEGQFMAGAERAYRALQSAWDSGDLEALRGLTTPAMFAELERQLRELPPQGHTEIFALRPELLEVREEDGVWRAAVLFDAELRETDDRSGRPLAPRRVREVWHFVRPAGADRPTWYLDGIQQVADD